MNRGRSPCTREHCSACASGKQHLSLSDLLNLQLVSSIRKQDEIKMVVVKTGQRGNSLCQNHRKPPRKSSLNLLIALVLSVLFLAVNWANLPIVTDDYPTSPEYTDPHWYRELAQGNIEHLPHPFSSRILLAPAVRALAATGYVNTNQATRFLFLGVVVFLVMVHCHLTSCDTPPGTWHLESF